MKPVVFMKPKNQRVLHVIRNGGELEGLIMEHLLYTPNVPKVVYRIDTDYYLLLETERKELATLQGPLAPVRIRLKRRKKKTGG